MIISELFKLGILADDYFTTAYTDIDLDIPAGATITLTYNNPNPERYVWFKIDTLYNPLMNNRVFTTSVYFREGTVTEWENIGVSKSWSVSPERCLHSGISGTSWTAVTTNNSSSTQTFDSIIRGILVDKTHLPLIKDIFTKTIIQLDDAAILKISQAKLNLSDDTINKLAEKMSECMKPMFFPQFTKKRE